ncbi:MAG TPA: tetratricopeptide repeat protein [Candidatus Eisenbacteria bacterium]|nr:tetratricopeptide repeat protein [Candidatus Eisenbacteria bacterium]
MTVIRNLSFAIALALTSFPMLSQSPVNPAARVSEALRARDFDKAIAVSQEALQQDPSDAQLWTLQGIAYGSKGDNQDAKASFERALKLAPNNLAALAGAAQIEYQEGSAGAIPLLNRLLQLRPGDPTANAMLAVLEYRKGNCAAAVSHFAQAEKLIDAQVEGLHAYATCLVKLKRFDEAIKTLQKAVALQPQDARQLQVLASVQLMAQKPQDALATLKPLLEVPKQDPGVLQLASRAYEDTGDTPHAVSALREALLLNPKDTSLYLDFANICFAHQSFQVGIDVITEGLSLQPKADDLYVARGVLYVQLAQYDKAEADFEKAYELNPNQSMSIAAQGLAAVQANDLDHALASVQQKLKLKPNDPLLLYLQADVLSQKGIDPGTPEFELAMTSAKKAVALQPNLASARAVLAKLYMQTEQYPEAIEQCRKALDIDPKDQTAVYRLIQALRKTGQTKEIPDLLKRLAQLREDATKEEREKYRYKLLEENPSATQP